MPIALVAPSQYDSLVDLLCELHAHYHEGVVPSAPPVRAHLVEHLLAEQSPLRLVVACDDAGTVQGLAAIALTWSVVEFAPEHRRQCQLKELYVRSQARSHGVGRALMAWVARYALSQGCGRMDWPVKASNARGIAFYQGLGAQWVADRQSFRLALPAMQGLAFDADDANGVAGAAEAA